MENVCGLFDSKITAENAMVDLLSAKIEQSQISLVISEKTRDAMMVVGRDEAGEASKGAVTGAVLGGAFATLAAGAMAVGAIAIPGSALLFAGPVVAALSGGAVGAVAGGLIGALLQAGLPQAEAEKYEAEIKNGKALLIVHPETDEQATLARSIIVNSGRLTAAA